MSDALAPGGMCAQQIDRAERGDDKVGLQHLDIEAQTDQHRTQQQPTQATLLRGAANGPCAQQQEKDKDAIDNVAAITGYGHRHHSHGQGSEQTRATAKIAGHEVVEQPD